MRVLITGNNGYIGRVMTKMMIHQGYEVVGLDTDYFFDCNLKCAEDYKVNIQQINKDIRDISENDLEGIDAVYHLAALSNDPLGELNPKLTEEINHKASLKIAKLAKRAGVRRFLFSSSCSMYGISTKEALTEEDDMNPLTAYARSKVNAEKDISTLADKDFSPVFLRNATAYGVSPKMRFDLVLNNLFGYAFTTGKVVIKSDGTPWRPMVHVEDISRAFIAAIEAPIELVHNQAFNVGQNEENHQIRDMANVVKEVVPNCEIEYTYEHGADSRTYNVSFDKIHNTLRTFRPEWNIKKGAAELYRALKEANLTYDDFMGRKYIRLKQLTCLLEENRIDSRLYWRGES